MRIHNAPAGSIGWLGALADTRIGRALGAIHDEPFRRWSVSGLAHVAGMSRSSFAKRFTILVGEPPLQYKVRWCLTLPKDLLETGDLLVSDVTRRVEDLRFGGNFNRLKNLMARNDGVQAIELGHDDRAPLRPPRSQRCGQLGPSVQRIGALASLDLHELANDFELFCLGKSRDEFVLGLSTAPYTAPPSWPMQVLVPTLSTGDVVVMARTSALMSRMIK